MTRRGTGAAAAGLGQVVVVGSVNLDLVAHVPRLPLAGETVTGGTFARHHGGKGANQAVAAARFGAVVRFVGAIGDDEMAPAARVALAAEGIDTAGLEVLPHTATGVALITVDANGENQIAVAPGANAQLRGEAVRRALEGALRPPGVLLELGPLLVLNEAEAETLGRADSIESSARALADRTGAPVVVTLGQEGALLVDGPRVERLAAHRVDAVDTTGAGDTVCGVLAAEVAGGRAIGQAIETAMAAAALSVMVAGAREGMPSRSDVEAFLASRA